MAASKHIDRICIAAVILALVVSVLFLGGEHWGLSATGQVMGYENRLFDTSRVHTIDIVIDDWDAFLATAQSEEYSACHVVIDGERFSNVGIRGKGNTSLSNVASMNSQRYSFKIEFDQYDTAKTYYGLDKLSLNNLIQDNTMMKDYLTYQMMGQFGACAPLCSYAYLRVNGEDWGLYLAVEAIEESFLLRNYGASYGELYKPDSMALGGGRGNGKDFAMEDFTPTPLRQATPQADGRGTSDAKLQYINDELSSYATIFSSAKTDVTQADQQRLVKSLRALSEQTDLEAVVDVEAVMRYFVVHNYVVNGDSYTGSMVHNYYLYEKDGQLSMLPWDYNLAFGTFQSRDAAGAVNDDIDAPLSVTGEGLPMIDWIWSSEAYTQMYHNYFRDFLADVDAQGIIENAHSLIAPYVEKDPTKFCTTQEFEAGVAALQDFCQLRTQSVASQLAGSGGNIQTGTLNIADMGTMGGKGGNTLTAPEGQTGNQLSPMPGGQMPTMPGEQTGGQMPTMPDQTEQEDTTGQVPGGMERPEGMGGMRPNQGQTNEPQRPGADLTAQAPGPGAVQSPWLPLGISALILLAGLIFAFKFKR